MRELAEAFERTFAIKRQAASLQPRLKGCRIEAQDRNRVVTYLCDGEQRPIEVKLKPEAIADCSAEEVSERVQAVLREGYRCSKAHMLVKSKELVGDFESNHWEQPQESLRQKKQAGAIAVVKESGPVSDG